MKFDGSNVMNGKERNNTFKIPTQGRGATPNKWAKSL
jgi:hypothetical protein